MFNQTAVLVKLNKFKTGRDILCFNFFYFNLDNSSYFTTQFEKVQGNDENKELYECLKEHCPCYVNKCDFVANGNFILTIRFYTQTPTY